MRPGHGTVKKFAIAQTLAHGGSEPNLPERPRKYKKSYPARTGKQERCMLGYTHTSSR